MNQYYAYNVINELYSMNLNDEESILNRYASPDENIGIPLELPDRITNVNGNHNYKLLSAKDINFNNVLLPNSIISENNWGSFDENRRWASGAPVYINDVYELMNVIDYLLCVSEDLWDEINKIKYSDGLIANLWFINDLNGSISSTNAINGTQFTSKNSNYAVLLNPKTYYTTLPQSTMANFGIATEFNENDIDYPIIRKVLQQQNKRNGIQAYIEYEYTEGYSKTQNENVEGRIVPIYGYPIGNELHFYPMFNIDNFFKSSLDDINNYDSLIDYTKMKLKYDLYFRIMDKTTNKSTFEKIYIDFLYSNWENIGRPYILYFIDSNNKRQIIYIHTENGGVNKTVEGISRDLLNYSEYINYFYYYNTITDSFEPKIDEFGYELEVYSSRDGLQYPYLYHISDSSRISLYVQTPNSNSFSLISNTLDIQYFKNINSLTANIKLPNDNIISSTEDKEQKNALLYSPQRYNIPDNTDINIDVTGNFLKNNEESIKFDDEYIDVFVESHLDNEQNMFFVSSDAEAQEYYYYNGLDENGKRKFVQFQTATELNTFFNSDNNNAITVNNIDSIKCAHVYKKNNDAYQLKYKVTTNSLLNQINDYSVVVEQAANIQNNIVLNYTSNKHTIILNYDLPGQLEQIKFDLNLYVDETSKVQSTNLSIPFSLNKMHQPCIQFINKEIIEQEIKDYSIYLTYTFGDRPDNNIYDYKYTNKVIPGGQTNSFLIYGVAYTKTNQDLIQGINDENDQFNNFQELYTYVIERKYNNFVKKDYNNVNVRTDILAHIDNDRRYTELNYLNSLEETFEQQYTYDNSISNMNNLIISYHPSNSILNLFGGSLFENYLRSISTQANNMVEKQALAYFDGVTYYPALNNEQYITFKNIFSINGLGFNYRLHGGDSYLYINKEGSGINTHNGITDLPFDNQYDLLCNGCYNDENNIIKFMQISVTDENNQLQNITKTGDEIEENSTKFIETNIFDIEAFSYQAIVQKDFFRYQFLGQTQSVLNRNDFDNFTMTYYVPMVYINVKSTTFYPDSNILPEQQEYNLANDNDVLRYSKYIEYWNSTTTTNGVNDEVSKYKPITLSIKLNENSSNNTPFFYESNTAKLKFNIRRIDPKIIDNTSDSKYNPEGITVNLAINQRYYLSDFIKTSAPEKILNSIGSYPEYNETTGKFDIHEFFVNNINESEIIYPIYKTNGNYLYHIDKVSKLNKIHFNNVTFNSHNLNQNIIDYNVLYWFDSNIDNINSLLSGDNITSLYDDSNNGLKLILSNGTIYGNKNYTNNILSAGPEIQIKFIHRTKPNENADNINIKSSENGPAIKTNKTDDGTFQFPMELDNEGQPIDWTFKHYEFYSVNLIDDNDTTHELLEIPDFSLINNIYIYNESTYQMTCLADYLPLQQGLNDNSFKIYYGLILDAFNQYKIYEHLI